MKTAPCYKIKNNLNCVLNPSSNTCNYQQHAISEVVVSHYRNQ